MKKTLTLAVVTIGIFLGLLVVAPMVTQFTMTGDCDDQPLSQNSIDIIGNCDEATQYDIVFPVLRTFACLAWHQPSCAPDTFLPGWYDGLVNIPNAIILVLMAGGSYLIARRLVS